MANTTKVTYTDAQKKEGQQLFAQLRTWGSKDGKPATSNKKLAGAIALLNDVKDNAMQWRNYDQLPKIDSLINAIKAFKVDEQERITALVAANAQDNHPTIEEVSLNQVTAGIGA